MPARAQTEIRAPFSGSVEQTINPWTWFYRMTGVEIGQFNVYLGDSTNPALERQILETVGTYGRQIGQIGDVLAILLRRADLEDLSPDEAEAVTALRLQLAQIDLLKRRAGAAPGLPRIGPPGSP